MTLFGASIDASQVEEAIQARINDWIDTYLVDVERQNSLADRAITRPRSWRIDDEVEKLPEDVLPALVVVSPGELRPPEDTMGDGTLDGLLQVGVVIIVTDSNRTTTRRTTRRYSAAVAKLLDQKGGTFGGTCRLASHPAQRFDERLRGTPGSEYLGVAYITFNVLVEGLRQRFGGPDIPAPTPPTGAPAYPDPYEVTSTSVTFTPSQEP